MNNIRNMNIVITKNIMIIIICDNKNITSVDNNDN